MLATGISSPGDYVANQRYLGAGRLARSLTGTTVSEPLDALHVSAQLQAERPDKGCQG